MKHLNAGHSCVSNGPVQARACTGSCYLCALSQRVCSKHVELEAFRNRYESRDCTTEDSVQAAPSE